jgi:hypothetical protein
MMIRKRGGSLEEFERMRVRHVYEVRERLKGGGGEIEN